MEKRELSEKEKQGLREIFHERVSFKFRERRMYSHDVGVMPRLIKPLIGSTTPAAVVRPKNEKEILSLVKWARENKVPLVPRGAATSGYAGVVPTRGGVVVDLTLLDEVHLIDEENMLAVVGPGIVWEELEETLNKKGLSCRMVPSSAPASTVGGWLAQNGAGFGSYEYGWFSENVVSARVVLPNSEVKEFSGKNLSRIAGSMGTVGFITQVKLKLRKLEKEVVVGAKFLKIEELGEALNRLAEEKVPLWSVSFINSQGARLKNEVPPKLHHGKVEETRVQIPLAYIALFVFPESRRSACEKKISQIIKNCGGERLSKELAEHEWSERFNPMRLKRIGPSIIPTEVVVPLSGIKDFILEAEAMIRHPFFIEGMVVRGDEVVILGFIPHDERKLSFNLAYGLSLSVIKLAKRLGGRPYAAGLYFAHEAERVYGEAFGQIKRLKESVDSSGIMNPEKLEGKALLRKLMGLVEKFEPLVRLFGNMAKVPLGERFEEKKGLPGDVVWYAYACAQCGYCVRACTQFYGRGWESQSPRGKWFWIKEYLEGRESLNQEQVNTFLVCTTCELCDVNCQIDLPIEPSWMKLRDLLVEKRNYMTLPPFYMMAASARKERNIWADYARNRGDWVPEELKEKIKTKADIAYFAGCTASFVEQDIAKATATLLDAAGVEFTYLAEEEACCGIPMLVAGKWDVFQEIMRHNIGAMERRGVKTVVTSCPACWLVWHTYYPQWAEKLGIEYNFETKHYSEVLEDKIESGELKFTNEVKAKVTFHDSCHIGRAGGVYEPPRKLIKAIPGVEYVEMEHNKEDALCCGSVLTLVGDPEIAPIMGGRRLEEAEKVNAEALLALCPCCQFQLRVSANKLGKDIPVKDLASFAARGLGYDFKDSTPDALAVWAVFERMIYLMRPENLASLMEDILPQMMAAMPSPLGSMMKAMKYIPGGFSLMKPMIPLMMPLLMPLVMPRVFDDMVKAVEKRVSPMPQVMREQMPELLKETMDEMMPKVLPEVARLITPKMIDYLREN